MTSNSSQGPVPGRHYPLTVTYCGECTLPVEYCEFTANYDKCLAWLERTLPDLFSARVKLQEEASSAAAGGGSDPAANSATAGAADDTSAAERKRQTRGGKTAARVANKSKRTSAEPRSIVLTRAPRGKKKFVTVVVGLHSYGVDLKEAAKFFGSRFACGSSVTGDDEIVIQGDVKDDLFDVIPEKWKDIDEDMIDDRGDQKR